LIDVNSDHVGTVSSDFQSQKIKTESQAERLEHEAEDFEHDAEKKGKEASKKAKAKYHAAKKDAESTAHRASKKLRDNSDNPVYIGNMVAVATVSAVLGFGAYNKYSNGELDWKVAGIWGGAVGAFAVGDYYLSQCVFRVFVP
jgi:hypothetical protein